ncbi:MAG: cell-cell cohesion protein MtsD [Myxococcota bacterium]
MNPLRKVAALAAVTAAVGCTDAFIEPVSSEPTNLDDRLTLDGRVCTSPPDRNGFPVKVVVVIDQSGSMCVSDPPGAQLNNGFCQQFGSVTPFNQPARVRALNRLIQQFQGQPNVEMAVVPFETNVKNPWPGTFSGQRFARPDSTLTNYVNGLQAQLGKGTDYQGALAYAYGLIASDINATSTQNPQLLPRTRYVVVFLTDGTPFPRCSANDNLSVYADHLNPELTWADSFGAGDFCNQIDPQDPDAITGFIAGTDRNQNYQLFSYVDQLMELKSQFNVGDIRLHTVLLFNEAAVRSCGLICQDLYGQYPNVQPAQYPQAAKAIARWLLSQFAQRGNGVFQEFNDGEIQNLGLGALDYSSLASRNVMKTLLVHSLRSMPAPEGPLVDSDGDGLPDTLDNNFTYKTNNFFPDSDGDDCFDDRFEVLRADRGFDPAVKDGRGCNPASPLTLGCRCRDTDGDGLSQFAEEYLKTHSGLVDSDGDGVPDGLEARYGLDSLSPSAAGIDTDGDGLPDLEEFRANSDPTQRDRAYFERNGYVYEVRSEDQADDTVCYDFTVANLPLVTPPNSAGTQQGYNLFKVYFAEAPESGVATDYGVWRTACAWAQYDPPSIRVPLGPNLTFADSDFLAPDQLNSSSAYNNRCIGVAP